MNDKYYLVESILMERNILSNIFKGTVLSFKVQGSLLINIPKIILKNLKSKEKSIKKTSNEINKVLDAASNRLKSELGESNAAKASEMMTSVYITGFLFALIVAIRLAKTANMGSSLFSTTVELEKRVKIDTLITIVIFGIITPATEEYVRNLSARKGDSRLFAHVINAFETLTALMGNLFDVSATIKTRAPAIAMHYSASEIQQKLVNDGHPNVAFIVAFIIHSAFNISAMLIQLNKMKSRSYITI